MICTAIYTVHDQYGYGIHDRSTNFPDKLLPEINRISHNFGESTLSDAVVEVPSLRGCQLGQTYLLSLATRQVSAGRRYCRVVHYLFSGQDVEKVMNSNWQETFRFLNSIRLNTADEQESLLRGLAEKARPKPGCKSHIERLLMAAAAQPDSRKKVRLICENADDSFHYLNWLMNQLPSELRRSVSFVTNAQAASEGKGVNLVFCSAEADSYMKQTRNAGGELADTIVCSPGAPLEPGSFSVEMQRVSKYLSLPEAARGRVIELAGDSTDWDTFLELAQILHAPPKEALLRLLQRFGEEKAISYLRTASLSPDELRELSYIHWPWQARKLQREIRALCSVPAPTPVAKPKPAALPVPRKMLLLAAALALLMAIVLVFIGNLDASLSKYVLVVRLSTVSYTLRMAVVALLSGIFGGLITHILGEITNPSKKE